MASILPFAAVADPKASPLLLEQARQTALRQHPRITASELRALAAEQRVRQSQSSWFPSLSANGVAVGTLDENTRIAANSGLNNPSIFDRAAAGIALNQLVTDFGRTSRLASSARSHAAAEKVSTQQVQALLLLQVDASYFAWIQALSSQSVAAQAVQARTLQLEQVSALASNKLRSDLDLGIARASLDEARVLELRTQADAGAARVRLGTLMGTELGPDLRPSDPAEEPSGPVGVETGVLNALERRPDLLRLKLERDSAQALSRAERALNNPTLSVMANGGMSPTHDTRLPDKYGAAGLVFTVPLFNGGLYDARQKEAALRAASLDAEVRELESQVVADVKLAWLNLQNSLERLRLALALAANSRRAGELAQARYENGATSIVEFNAIQLGVQNAELQVIAARCDHWLMRSAWRYQTGTVP